MDERIVPETIDELFNDPYLHFIKYATSEIVKVLLMTRKEYNDLRGDGNAVTKVETVPADENPDDVGYVIVHTSSSNKYINWMPVEEFELIHKRADTFMDRVHIEIQDLETKLEKAQSAFDSTDLYENTDCEDRMLLSMQITHMAAYLQALKLRMQKLKNDDM